MHGRAGLGHARSACHGCSDDRENDLSQLLLRFELAAVDPTADFEAVARIYRRCRRTGVKPRSLIDCLIAAVA